MRGSSAALVAMVLVACSREAAFYPDDDGGSSDASSDAPSLPSDSGFALHDSEPSSGCTDAARLVYLVSQQNTLYSFDPGKLATKSVGMLDCPTGARPYDMAIDHDAHAYVTMDDGTFYQVDTSNAHCTATAYVADNSGHGIGATAFAGDGKGGETLFTSSRLAPVNGMCPCGTVSASGVVSCVPVTGTGLARLDLTLLEVVPIGLYGNGLDTQILALTGTGDGRLFGFYSGAYVGCDAVDAGAGSPPGSAALTELDRSTGAVKSTTPLSDVMGSAWAFSFWGGDFWFYSAGTGKSQVTRYKYSSDRSFNVVVADTGMTIVGAGVSTCAPVTPPN